MESCDGFRWQRVKCNWPWITRAPKNGFLRSAIVIGHKLWVLVKNRENAFIYVLDTVTKMWAPGQAKGAEPLSAEFHLANLNLFQDKIYLYKFSFDFTRPFCVMVFDPLLKELSEQPTFGDKPIRGGATHVVGICDRLGIMVLVFTRFHMPGVWILDLSTWRWTNPSVKGTPPLRGEYTSCIVDSRLFVLPKDSKRMDLEYGLLVLDLAQSNQPVWNKTLFTGMPASGHIFVGMTYVGRGRMIIFGGEKNSLANRDRSGNSEMFLVDDLFSRKTTLRQVDYWHPILGEPKDKRIWCTGDRPSLKQIASVLFANKKVCLFEREYQRYYEIDPRRKLYYR